MPTSVRIAPELFERVLRNPPSDALYQLDTWWCARPDRSAAQPRFGLSPLEFDVHLFLLYVGEVVNGGHSQFFMNQASNYTTEILAALDRLGLTELKAILMRACGVFPGGEVPTLAAVRAASISRFSESALQVWDAVDQQCYAAQDAFAAHVLAHVASRKDEVLTEERK